MTDHETARGLEIDESARRLLEIYLTDHRAGAVAGRRLAQRLARRNRDVEWAAPIIRVAEEVAEDEEALEGLRHVLEMEGGKVKRVVAAFTEIAGRVKLNGRLIRYSPLSRLLELETLIAGIVAKERLWVTLQRFHADWSGISGLNPAEMERRAEEQMKMLAGVHVLAVAAAFGTPSGGSTGG